MLNERNERCTCSTARISVTVTEFRELGRGPSRADVELTDTGHGKVTQARVNDVIVVHDAVYLDFSVSAREGDRYTYIPVGIDFKERRGAASAEVANDRHGDGRDLLGRAAFPLRIMASRGTTMQLTLFDANPEPAEFKFDLMIQRSDGALGIIDPSIGNRGTNM